MKIVYIAYPIEGDIDARAGRLHNIFLNTVQVEGDQSVVLTSLKEIIALPTDPTPFDYQTLTDSVDALLSSGGIDEVRLYGEELTPHLLEVVKICFDQGLLIVACEEHLYQPLLELVEAVPCIFVTDKTLRTVRITKD